MTVSTKKRQILLKASTAVALVMSAQTALAGDITVSTAITSQALSDGDNLIVTSDGSISNSAGAAVTESSNGITVSIDNAGTIESTNTNFGSHAIYLRYATLSSFVNSGTIMTPLGTGSYGVYINDVTTFSNSGTINTERGSVVVGGTTGSFTNDLGGTISSAIENGIFFGSTVGSFENNGSISSGNNSQNGVYFGSGFTDFLNGTTGSISGGTGIYTSANAGTLTNSGTITGTVDRGIWIIGDVTKITNNAGATIEGLQTSSTSKNAIYVGGILNSLENAGTIITGGTYSFAVRSQGGIGQLSNTGTISGGGGVYTDGSITSLTNSGKIEATGGYAIQARLGIKTLTNEKAGEIIGLDRGISSYDGGIENLNNAGTIEAEFPIHINGGTTDSTITNSGTIKSTNGASGVAIYFGNTAADTLNIEAGSNIIGQIRWDGTGDTVNFAAGTSNTLEFTNDPDNINFSSNLGAIVGNTVVQADTSSVSMADNAVSDVASSASARVGARSGTTSQPSTSSNEQGSESVEGFGYGVMSDFVDRNAWVSLWGAGSFQQTTSTLANTTAYSGGVLGGIDWLSSDGSLFGIHGGAGLGKVTVNVTDGQTTDSRSLFGGFYGRSYHEDIAIDYNVTAGMMQFDSDRSISGGTETAQSKYNGYFIQPEIKFSKETDIGGRAVIPSVGFGYKGVFLDGYTETGSTSNMTVSARAVHYALANTQIDLIADFKASNGDNVVFRPYVGADGSFIMGENTATASLLTTTTTFDTGGDKNVIRGFAGANFAKNLDETTKLFGGTEVSYNSSKNIAFNVRLGISKSF